MERFAPEGTAYVTVAFGTTGGRAYRYQVDNVTLKYTDNAEPVIQGENPLEKTISLGESVNLKLEELFIDPDGDAMEFSAEEGKGKIENGVYTFTPNKLGNVTTSVTATDSYDGKATLQLNITVNDAVSTSVPNKDIQQVTREVVNGTISFSKTDGTEVTSLTQLNAGDTLKINLSLKNTSEIPVTATLIIVKYDTNGVVESVTTKVVVIPTTNGEPDYTAVRDYIVDNNTGHIEVMLWDSATNLNSLTDPIIL